MEKLPEAVWSGTMLIGGATLEVFVLDNGQRIIEAGSLERFLAGGALAGASEDELRDLAGFVQGRDIPTSGRLNTETGEVT